MFWVRYTFVVNFITMQKSTFSVNDMKCAPQYSAYLKYYSIFYIRAHVLLFIYLDRGYLFIP